MTDRRFGGPMRWVSGALLLLTIVAVAWLGFAATSFSLTDTGTEVGCRSVLAPIVNASLAGGDQVPDEIVEAWLSDVGYDDSAEMFDAAVARGEALCADARTGRLGWMILVGTGGLGVSVGAAVLARPRVRQESEAA